MKFNPSEFDPDAAGDGKRSFDEREVPSGTYLVGISWFKRLSEKAVKFRFVVLEGPLKGASFFAVLPVNVDRRPSAERVWRMCGAFAISGELDLADDETYERLFVGRAGKVTVKVVKRGPYTNHDLDRLVHRDQLSPDERSTLIEWQGDYADSRAMRETRRDVEADDAFAEPVDEYDDEIPF